MRRIISEQSFVCLSLLTKSIYWYYFVDLVFVPTFNTFTATKTHFETELINNYNPLTSSNLPVEIQRKRAKYKDFVSRTLHNPSDHSYLTAKSVCRNFCCQ